MSSALYKGSLTAGQDVLKNFISQLSILGTPSLGPDFKKLSGRPLNDALIIHRITAKFEVPSVGEESASELRAKASIAKMLEYDASYHERRKSFFKGKGVLKTFLSARAWLHTTLKEYKPSYRCTFPSGESVNGNKGYVDLYYKLTTDSQWSVSADCVKYASKIAYHNPFVKKIVKDRFKNVNGKRTKILLKGWVNDALELRQKRNVHIGYYVFSRMFLYCVEITGYSRLTTVPKNNKEDRVITCDPTWNLIVQRSIALDLLSCLKKTRGIDLTTLQDIHRGRIAHRHSATVDFSKASDSNWLSLFKLLFPKKVVDNVCTARTGLFLYEGEYITMNQLAPMGCGFTFEIMSLTLLSYARVMDPGATVFGDDVIIHKHAAERFINFTTAMGWTVNVDKTFTDGNFSESCGGFYNHSTKEHILSYDFKYPITLPDLIVIGNKLLNLIEKDQCSPHVRRLLVAAYVKIVDVVPDVVLTGHAINEGSEGAQLRVPRELSHLVSSFSAKHHSYDSQQVNKYGKCFVWKPAVDIGIRRDDVDRILYSCYMYHGVKAIGPRTGKWVLQSIHRPS